MSCWGYCGSEVQRCQVVGMLEVGVTVHILARCQLIPAGPSFSSHLSESHFCLTGTLSPALWGALILRPGGVRVNGCTLCLAPVPGTVRRSVWSETRSSDSRRIGLTCYGRIQQPPRVERPPCSALFRVLLWLPAAGQQDHPISHDPQTFNS